MVEFYQEQAISAVTPTKAKSSILSHNRCYGLRPLLWAQELDASVSTPFGVLPNFNKFEKQKKKN